ncbi:MAG: hypothetical protein ACRD1F_05980, partial [Terriglobales bacterium]
VEEHYGWLRRGATVWLQQRPAHARQMPGLWELPPARPQDRGAMLLRLRHTITDARITAFVHEIRRPDGSGRQSMRWMSRRQSLAAPLSGLTRKILLRLWR